MQNNYIPNIDISSLITSDFDNENYKNDIDNYEDFLTNSLKKFVEYDRPN